MYIYMFIMNVTVSCCLKGQKLKDFKLYMYRFDKSSNVSQLFHLY